MNALHYVKLHRILEDKEYLFKREIYDYLELWREIWGFDIGCRSFKYDIYFNVVQVYYVWPRDYDYAELPKDNVYTNYVKYPIEISDFELKDIEVFRKRVLAEKAAADTTLQAIHDQELEDERRKEQRAREERRELFETLRKEFGNV